MASLPDLASLIPSNDQQRLDKLYEYEILDTPPEEAFDKIARLAAQIFDAPSAFVSFVDKERVFFKSNQSNLPSNQVARQESLCSLTILDDQPTVFPDTHQIPDLLSIPHVCCEGGIRFYAGVPIKTAQGYRVGSVCVADTVPRQATAKQLQMLSTLASIAVDELEQRLAAKKAIRVQTDLMHMAVHELKNPALNISALAALLMKKEVDEPARQEIAGMLRQCSEEIAQRLDSLLKLSQMEQSSFALSLEPIDLSAVVETAKQNFALLAGQKQQQILTRYEGQTVVKVDKARIGEVVENLLSNAIKYSFPATTITISLKNQAQGLLLAVQDQGQGLSAKDMEKLFTKFAKLSALPTGKERSNGLGLSIVKTLAELHKGRVWAESEGPGKGATFFLWLPQQESTLN